MSNDEDKWEVEDNMVLFLKAKGDFRNTQRYLDKMRRLRIREILDAAGKKGVSLLSNATPVDTGLTAKSWEYSIEVKTNGYKIVWKNSNVNDGVPIAILIQYGHATENGGFVSGRDYINPTMVPLIEQIISDVTLEVNRI